MAITAQSIINRCVQTLQDLTSIRWTLNELVRYLNDGQREIILYRPDSMVTFSSPTLVAGSRQTIPTGGAKLIEVTRNSSGNKRAIRLANREILDAQSPNWHSLTGVTEILHYFYDPRDPKTFYVYPPAAASGAQVDLIYAALPTDIALPGAGTSISQSLSESDTSVITGSLSVPDIFANTLQDYILYRAYAKDSEYAGNMGRAQAHYAAFANALGIEIKATMAAEPAVTGSPNTGAAVHQQG